MPLNKKIKPNSHMVSSIQVVSNTNNFQTDLFDLRCDTHKYNHSMLEWTWE